jgi:hypothetical protein
MAVQSSTQTALPREAPQAKTSVQMLLSVLASICVTFVAGALGSSPAGKLGGAALGAALPVLITAAGPWRHLRIGVALAAAGVALFVTYSGFTAANYATQSKPTFPSLPQVPTPGPPAPSTPTPTPSGTPTPHPPVPQIDVTPHALSCTSDGCASAVTIKSAGTGPLQIGDIDVAGEARADFATDGACAHTEIGPHETCELHVAYTPSVSGEVRHARLIIHQSLNGGPTLVALRGDATSVLTDLVAATAGVTCLYHDGSLRITFPLEHSGAAPAAPVHVSASSESGLAGQTDRSLDGDAATAVELPLRESDHGTTPAITLAVDPDDAIAEADESNNRLLVTVTVPSEPPAGDTALACDAERPA